MKNLKGKKFRQSQETLTIKLRGGLGNQLFQIVGAAYFARMYARTLVIDRTDIVFHKDKSRRSWSRQLNFNDILVGHPVRWRNMVSIVIEKARKKFGITSRVKEVITELQLKDFGYPESNATVTGWFENKNYIEFQPLRLSREIFEPKMKSRLLTSLNVVIQCPDTVTIHIRLGDFLWNSSSTRVPWDFYSHCLHLHLQKGVRRIVLFSDDLLIAKAFVEEITRINKCVEIVCPEKDVCLNPVELLWILSGAQNFIASNSTMSWWASAINNSGFVFSPFSDLLHLERWQQI